MDYTATVIHLLNENQGAPFVTKKLIWSAKCAWVVAIMPARNASTRMYTRFRKVMRKVRSRRLFGTTVVSVTKKFLTPSDLTSNRKHLVLSAQENVVKKTPQRQKTMSLWVVKIL